MGRVKAVVVCLSAAVLACTGGCVRRTVTITTDPQGADVWLNDEEIGRTPVSVDFLWYGDYDVILRLDGYETLTTHHELMPPWYELPGIDFFAEVLYPVHIHDERSMHFTLQPAAPPNRDALLERAQELRARAAEKDAG